MENDAVGDAETEKQIKPAQGDDYRESSDESDSDDESTVAAEINSAREYVQANPYSYEAYENLVRVLRTSDLFAVREARKEFANRFPLAPPKWLEWIEDEVRIAVTANDRSRIATDIYERALQDYVSVDIAESYLQFQLERYKLGEITKETLSRLFENLVGPGAAGRIFTDGIRIWRLYRQKMEEIGGSLEEKVSLLAKQLCLPLAGNNAETHNHAFETCCSEYRDKITDNQIATESCEIFEQKLINSGSRPGEFSGVRSHELVMQYMSYACHEETRVALSAVIIWERCVAECFLHPSVWHKYVSFCRKLLSDCETLAVVRRAVRNVPWDLDLWRMLLQVSEPRWALSSSSGIDELNQIMARLAPHVVMASDGFKTLQLARTIVLVFYTLSTDIPSVNAEHEVICTVLSFVEQGSLQWAELMSLICRLERRFKKNVLTSFMEQVVAARGNEARWWICYSQVVQDKAAAEQLFRRGMEHMSDEHEVRTLGDAWLAFEMSCALKRNTDIYLVFDAMDDKLMALTSSDERNETFVTHARARAPPPLAKPRRKKRKAAEHRSKPIAKEQSKSSKDEIMCDSHAEHDDGYKRSDAEPRVVYVNNLPFTATTEELRRAFQPAGGVRDVRLPVRSDGATKGFAYVEFDNEESVEAAIALHKMKICGREAWVRRSKPPRKSTQRTGPSNSSSASGSSKQDGFRGKVQNSTRRKIIGGIGDRSGTRDGHSGMKRADDEVMQDDNGDASSAADSDVKYNQGSQLRQSDFREMFFGKS